MRAGTLLDRPVSFPCAGRARSRWCGRVTPRIGSLACSASSLRSRPPCFVGSRPWRRARRRASTEAVLAKLGFSAAPDPDRAGLDAVYAAWCRRVPFDNLVKRIHLVRRLGGPIPNGPPEAFFASWLAPRHRRHVLAERPARCTRSSARSASTPGAARRRCTTTSPARSTRTARRSCGSTASTTGSTRRCSPSARSRSSRARRHGTTIRCSPVRSEPVDDLWRVWWTTRRSPTRSAACCSTTT